MLRRFDSPKEYVDNVALSRIYIGVHYRFSVDAGVAMGTKVGELTAQRFFSAAGAGGAVAPFEAHSFFPLCPWIRVGQG